MCDYATLIAPTLLTSGNFNADLGPLNYREVFRED